MNLACSGHALVVPVPGKVVKIRPKHFSTVLTGNDKNNTTNYVGMFRVQNRVIWARFSTLPTLVVLVPEKVIKIQPKLFLAIVATNDKNYTPNYVGMFLLQNRVIRPRCSNLVASGLHWWYPGPERSSKFDPNIFQPYWRETIKTAPKPIWMIPQKAVCMSEVITLSGVWLGLG